MDVFNGAHVQTACGLDGDNQWLVPVDLSGNDRFLLVAAGHTAHHGNGPLSAADVVLFNEQVGVVPDGILLHKAKLLEPGFLETLQYRVLLQGKVQDQAVFVTILRDMAEVFQPFAYGGVADFFPAQGDRTTGGFLQTGDAMR